MPATHQRDFLYQLRSHTHQPHTHQHPRIPKYFQDATCLFYLIEERKHHHIKKSVNNFRKPLEVGLKLAITLRHLARGDTYTSLPYHWLVGQTTPFVPQVCQAIHAEVQDKYLHCPDTPDKWKRVEEKFRTRWNVPHAVVAIDRKHIAINKPKKTDSDYYNYKGFFSLVLLALVDRFLWSSNSCGQVIPALMHRFSTEGI